MRPDGRPSGPRRPEQARVFFALWPDDRGRAALHRAALDGAKRFGGRPMRADTLHLTLAFIGDVPVDRLPALRAAADRVDSAAFDMTMDSVGFWAHNRILWAGSRQGCAGLAALAKGLQQSLLAAGWATGDKAGRDFAPHVTLVRKVEAVPRELPGLVPLVWRCERFVLVRSRLSSSGSAYETLGHWPLR